MDMNFLKQKIVEKNETMDSVAKSAGMDRSTMYRKMKKGSNGFTVGEAKTIADVLQLTQNEAEKIFF